MSNICAQDDAVQGKVRTLFQTEPLSYRAAATEAVLFSMGTNSRLSYPV